VLSDPTNMRESPATPRAGNERPARYALMAAGVCVACFLSVAPFLPLYEFSNGGENAVVASVQEIHRGGPWLVPTLHEEQRTKKPPLATWLSALASDAGTVARQSDPDPAVRDAAFRAFGWQVRWPALLAMCGLVAATYGLGAAVGGPRLGLVSCLVCASSLFWLRYARLTTTDAHLALWVAVANCLLAAAVLDGRRRWLALVGGGGLALGLAMMSKGPVALLQTVVPALAFLAWRRWWWERETVTLARVQVDAPDDWPVSYAPPPPEVERRSKRARPPGGWLAPLLAGLVVFVAVGFTWYLLVWRNNPAVVAEWRRELTREGATGLPPSKWYAYAKLVLEIFPWGFFLVVGLIGTATIAVRRAPGALDAERDRAGRAVLPLVLLLVPILVMSLFRDREMRYLMPLLAPASVVIAWGVLDLLVTNAGRRGTAALVLLLHWTPLAVATLAPLFASRLGPIVTMEGEPWYSLRFAVLAAEVMLVLVVVAAWLQRRRPALAVAGGTALVMLIWGAVLNQGYRQHREGRSEMRPLAERILATHPGATVYSFRPDRPIRKAPIDLSIYLNRVVENVLDLAQMDATSGPRVLLIRYKAGQPAPPPPAGWTLFAEAPNDDSVWYAYTPPAPVALPPPP
jgi:4-amino-4-deoxy-L-arabinose transferase-like glycosyltransferase